MAQAYKNTDVLIIGGGLAGCWAAIRAKAFSPSVTLVDKAVISRSGASAWAYYFLAPPPEKDLSLWKRELVEKGDYLSNQDWMDRLLEEHGQRLADMESWGVPFERNGKGQLIAKAGRGHKSTRFVTSDARPRMEVLKNKARELGVNIIERVMLTDLLTSDGRLPTSGSVIGAVGFHTRTGEPFAIKSKAVIIASGPMHQDANLTGDGTAMAFRAGAELMSMEFCIYPYCFVTDGKHFLTSLNVLFQGLGIRILNSKGERFMEKYDPVLKERSNWSLITQAIAKETFEGRGPAMLDMSEVKDEDIAYFAKLHPGKMVPLREAGVDLKKDKLMVTAQIDVSSANGDGGIRIDTLGRTNIPGLYGAGTTCKNQVHGTYSVGGMNLAFCCTSGYRAGETSAKESLMAKEIPVDQKQAESLIREALLTLEQQKGVLPATIFKEISKITEPGMISIIKREDRIKKTLTDLDSLENKELKFVKARDCHELVRANEAKNMVLLSKLTFLSSLSRKESRDSHYRQDYPYRDDINWLKWVIIKQDVNKEIKVRVDPVPFERYKIQPDKRVITPSPIKFE